MHLILVLCIAKALRERELELVLAKVLLDSLEPVQEALVVRHALCWQHWHHTIIFDLQQAMVAESAES